MLTNKLVLVVALFMVSIMISSAQFSRNPQNDSRASSVQYIYSLDRLSSPVEYNIEGTPYYNEVYINSHVYSQKGNFSDVQMRYNIFYDRMEFKEEESLHGIDPDLLINKIVIGNKTFVVENFELKDEVNPTYFMRLDSGRVILMTKLKVVFKDRQVGKPIEGDIPAAYQRMDDVNYIKIDGGPLIKVRNIKKLIVELPDQKKEMEHFARKEKISANKEEELTKFIQYYNSLK